MDGRFSPKVSDSIYLDSFAAAKKYRDIRTIVSFESNHGTILYNTGRKQPRAWYIIEIIEAWWNYRVWIYKSSRVHNPCRYDDGYGEKKDGINYYEKGPELSRKFGYPQRYLMLADKL